MTKVDKWNIPGLKKSLRYCEAAPIVLDKKLKDVFQLIDEFFKDDSPEVLHDMRIAVRRFRYVLEIFFECFDKKLLKKVYNYSKSLQDLVGEGRDLDVLGEKIRELGDKINVNIPQYLFDEIAKTKIEMRRKIKLELIKFKSDKSVNKFIIQR